MDTSGNERAQVERAYIVALWRLLIEATAVDPISTQSGNTFPHPQQAPRCGALEELIRWDDDTIGALMRDLWDVTRNQRGEDVGPGQVFAAQMGLSRVWMPAVCLINSERKAQTKAKFDEGVGPRPLKMLMLKLLPLPKQTYGSST